MPMQREDIQIYLQEISKCMHQLPTKHSPREDWISHLEDAEAERLMTEVRSAIQRSANMVAYLWDTIEAERARIDIEIGKFKARLEVKGL